MNSKEESTAVEQFTKLISDMVNELQSSNRALERFRFVLIAIDNNTSEVSTVMSIEPDKLPRLAMQAALATISQTLDTAAVEADLSARPPDGTGGGKVFLTTLKVMTMHRMVQAFMSVLDGSIPIVTVSAMTPRAAKLCGIELPPQLNGEPERSLDNVWPSVTKCTQVEVSHLVDILTGAARSIERHSVINYPAVRR